MLKHTCPVSYEILELEIYHYTDLGNWRSMDIPLLFSLCRAMEGCSLSIWLIPPGLSEAVRKSSLRAFRQLSNESYESPLTNAIHLCKLAC